MGDISTSLPLVQRLPTPARSASSSGPKHVIANLIDIDDAFFDDLESSSIAADVSTSLPPVQLLPKASCSVSSSGAKQAIVNLIDIDDAIFDGIAVQGDKELPSLGDCVVAPAASSAPLDSFLEQCLGNVNVAKAAAATHAEVD